MSATHQRVLDTRFTAETAVQQVHGKKFVESAHTKPRRSIIAICFGIHLSFTISIVCCVFTDCGFYIINILNQRFYRTTFVRYLFAFSDLQYIKYKMEQRFIIIPAKTRKTTLES